MCDCTENHWDVGDILVELPADSNCNPCKRDFTRARDLVMLPSKPGAYQFRKTKFR